MSRKVRVADEPGHAAPSYAQLIRDADTASEPFIDDDTPPGHFGVTVKNIGGTQTYWLVGELADPNAMVVARTQHPFAGFGGGHYIGCSFLGGRQTSEYVEEG